MTSLGMIEAAAGRLEGHARRTPMLNSPFLDEIAGLSGLRRPFGSRITRLREERSEFFGAVLSLRHRRLRPLEFTNRSIDPARQRLPIRDRDIPVHFDAS